MEISWNFVSGNPVSNGVIFTARKRSSRKVMFLHLCVILFTGEGVSVQGGGLCLGDLCRGDLPVW